VTLTAGQSIYVSVEATLQDGNVNGSTVEFGAGAQLPAGSVLIANSHTFVDLGGLSGKISISSTALVTPGAGTWTFGAAASITSGAAVNVLTSHVSVLVLN
jgi:hypothetical protein